MGYDFGVAKSFEFRNLLFVDSGDDGFVVKVEVNLAAVDQQHCTSCRLSSPARGGGAGYVESVPGRVLA